MVCADWSRKLAHSSVHRGYLVVIEADQSVESIFLFVFLTISV